MFKLVGCEEFQVGESKCCIKIEPFGLFAYRYSLEVDGKPFKKFIERQSKILKTWTIKTVDGSDLRVVLGKTTCMYIFHKYIPNITYYRKRHYGCLGEWTESRYSGKQYICDWLLCIFICMFC